MNYRRNNYIKDLFNIVKLANIFMKKYKISKINN